MLYRDVSKNNEFTTWLIDPKEFVCFHKKRNERYFSGKPFDVVIGITSLNEKKVQGYKYPVKFWTKNQAKKHCTENKGVNFVTATVRKKYTDIRKLPGKIKKLPKQAQFLWLFSYNEIFGKNSEPDKAKKFAKKIITHFFKMKNKRIVLKEEFKEKPLEYFLSRMKGFANE